MSPVGDGPGRGSSVRLRRVRWWDVEALVPLERELFGATAWSAETFWSELAQADSRWYVLAEEAAPVDTPSGAASECPSGGTVLGYAGLLSAGPEADVQTLAVARHAQGRRLGAELLSALLAEAARRGCTAVLLEVRADNDVAIGLYQRFGFERIAVRRRYYQPGGVDAWIMRLRPLR